MPPTGAAQPPAQPQRRDLVRLVRFAARTTDSYGLLFVLLLIDYLLLSLVTGRWYGLAVGVPLSLTLLLAMRTSDAHPRGVRAAQIAVVVALAAGLANGIFRFTGGDGTVTLILSLLLVTTPFVIVRRILQHPTVSVETILGAICIYILIGLFFAVLFDGIARLLPVIYGTPLPKPHWFLAQAPAEHPPAAYLYLSFVTMTTVGFGDLTPLNSLARSIVVLEALIGQIFLVTLVARLVTLYGVPRPTAPARLHSQPGDQPPDDGGADEQNDTGTGSDRPDGDATDPGGAGALEGAPPG